MIGDRRFLAVFPTFSSTLSPEIRELDPLGWPMHSRYSALPLSLTSEDRCNSNAIYFCKPYVIDPSSAGRVRTSVARLYCLCFVREGLTCRCMQAVGYFPSGLPAYSISAGPGGRRGTQTLPSSLLARLGCRTARSARVARCENPHSGVEDASITADKSTQRASLVLYQIVLTKTTGSRHHARDAAAA